ncbi:MAG: 16S rRNA (cytosine(1402)-N(4))-methyltransferase RsmH [Bacteroidales bacterium]|jgi:16S rRNA (cytosine1402-N4)-methyltransferase|nr:16S rRNA (cytosine(1402)-N(4))-methyltransferase RsmH [Bacteroidales bacterium]
MYHIPVLLDKCIEGLAIRPEGTYVDVTFGGGGHSQAILKKLESGRLLAFDQDADAMQNIPADDRLIFINQNFRYLINFMRLYKALPADGILADLGISSHQIDLPERGFSTRFEAGLDLRMDRKARLSAREVVNEYPLDELKKIFAEYGEIRHAFRTAQQIIAARQSAEIDTTVRLKEVLAPLAERGRENKFFAQVFQALRIEVNGELDALRELLIQSVKAIKPGGRLVVLSYHSLEDRLVKNFIKTGNFEGTENKDFFGNLISPFTPLTRKPIVPDEAEISLNPRARSAKLRIAERRHDA